MNFFKGPTSNLLRSRDDPVRGTDIPYQLPVEVSAV